MEVMHSEEYTEFCTIREAALISRLAIKTWYQGAAGTCIVPRVRFGRSIRLLRTDVERFVSERIREARHNSYNESNHPAPSDPDPLSGA
jgi:hypothetical protein